MSDTATISRPALTLPEAEAAHLRAAYEEAQAILEYGSGGSTVMAAEMPGKRVWSVESDGAWAEMMRGWFTANPPANGTQVEVIWADIGPTKQWGHPKDRSGYLRYARYPLGIWEREDVTPDLVLVDGRCPDHSRAARETEAPRQGSGVDAHLAAVTGVALDAELGFNGTPTPASVEAGRPNP